ncbi:MAG: class I SAM-dependent methyltransferase [Acidimicrobiia bacterium]|nr:class I SAM-dependent methyltransferase [Acidimicrobiia bacterium]
MGQLLQLKESSTSIQAPPLCCCLVCESDQIQEFLNLGNTPLANRFLEPGRVGEPEPEFPLRAGFCERCHHVQLLDRVPPGAMFDHYLYVSSASETLTKHLHGLASTVAKRRKLRSRDLVVDIGSNDGTLLSGFARHGVRTLGVDPAANLAPLAQANGIETLTAFFGEQAGGRIRREYGPAAVITATNSFPHIPDLGDYLAGVERLLAPDGVLVIEAHYLMDILEQRAFDTIYHEHVSYWALGPARRLLQRHGLEVVDVERLPVHHGQLRMWIQRAGAPVKASVEKLESEEKGRRMDQLETYQRFAAGTRLIKRDLRRLLDKIRYEDKTIAAYGAPAKGMTLLSYLELGPETIDFIADRSPLKQGRYTPGSHIPIVPPERILQEQPDFLLLLAWNFADEVMKQQREYHKKGGRFIVPVPEVRIV